MKAKIHKHKILFINLLISILINISWFTFLLNTHVSCGGIAIVFLTPSVLILIQAFINLILCLKNIRKNKKLSRKYGLSAILLIPIAIVTPYYYFFGIL